MTNDQTLEKLQRTQRIQRAKKLAVQGLAQLDAEIDIPATIDALLRLALVLAYEGEAAEADQVTARLEQRAEPLDAGQTSMLIECLTATRRLEEADRRQISLTATDEQTAIITTMRCLGWRLAHAAVQLHDQPEQLADVCEIILTEPLSRLSDALERLGEPGMNETAVGATQVLVLGLRHAIDANPALARAMQAVLDTLDQAASDAEAEHTIEEIERLAGAPIGGRVRAMHSRLSDGVQRLWEGVQAVPKKPPPQIPPAAHSAQRLRSALLG